MQEIKHCRKRDGKSVWTGKDTGIEIFITIHFLYAQRIMTLFLSQPEHYNSTHM